MKIIFLGSGSLEGIPSPFCKCEVCSKARLGGKNKRFRSSIFLEFNDKKSLIIDCTPDFKNQIETFQIPVDNIFISHGHYDHYSGLGELSYLSSLYHIFPTIFGKQDVIDNCKKIYNFFPLKFSVIKDDFFKIGKTKIEVIPVNHAKNTTTSGLYFNKVLIIPEIYNMSPKVKEELIKKKIDLLIIDGAYYQEPLYKDHFTIQRAKEFSIEFGAKRTIITNIWHKSKLHEILTKEFNPLEIAYDGMIINTP